MRRLAAVVGGDQGGAPVPGDRRPRERGPCRRRYFTGPARTFLRLLSQEAATAGCGVLLVAHDTKSARNLAMAGQDPGAGAVAGSAA